MEHVPPDLPRLLLTAATGLIVLAGATADLVLAFWFQRRDAPLRLPAQDELARRPFSFLHAVPVLFATLIFALPPVFQKAGASHRPAEASLILGTALYALAGALAVWAGLFTANATLGAAFASAGCTPGRALRKGILYGLATLPPVMLLSHLMAASCEALGYELQRQEVFDWLNDGALSIGTRLFLMFAAVVIAPVVEETLFRGVLFPAMLKSRTFASAALLTGAYFALVHFHAPSFLPLLALSVAFSAAYAATGSLLTPIVMHALFNATSLLLYLSDPA